jgi:hypothetical protein
MEAKCLSETLVDIQQTTLRYLAQEKNFIKASTAMRC